MFNSVLWRVLVEKTNRYAKTHNISNWEDVTTAEKRFPFCYVQYGPDKKK